MRLSNQQQHVLALGILGILLLMIYSFVIAPVLTKYQTENQQIETLTDQLQRYKRLSDSRDYEAELLKKVKQDSPLKSFFLEGETRSVVSAKLQQKLKQVVAQTGGQIVSTQGLPQTTDNTQSIPGVTLKVQLKAGIDELKELLFAMETSRPGLYVENLSISSSPVRNSSYAKRQVMPPLDIRFNLTGYTTGKTEL